MEIPGFEIRRELGRGGSARVYLAWQTAPGRTVALKVLEPSAGAGAAARLAGARMAAGLRHPNIVRVYEAGTSEGVPYVAMEYLPGGDLHQRLHAGLDLAEVIAIAGDIAAALDHAHAAGVLHGDVKPENILFRGDVGANERPPALLSDFGVARRLPSAGAGAQASGDPGSAEPPGIVATPAYMSPELAAGRDPDHRSDLYSLGAVVHCMLAGEPPHRGDLRAPVFRLHEAAPVLPKPFEPFTDALGRMLAPMPEARFPSGAEFSRALEAVPRTGQEPEVVVRSATVTTEEVQAVDTIGDAGEALVARGEPERRPGTRRRTLLWTAGTAVVLAAAMTMLRPEWLASAGTTLGLAEDAAVATAWDDAEALVSDPSQSLGTVVAAYRRVLEIDPGHPDAAGAIDAAAALWKEDVGAAIGANDLALAEAKLDELAAQFPSDDEVSTLFNRLRNRRHAEQLIVDTQRLLEGSGLSDEPSATAAIQAYQEVLRLSPGDPTAATALDALAAHYTDLARESLLGGNLGDAMDKLGRAVTANPQFAGLEAVRAMIADATTLQAQIDAMLQEAAELREAGFLIDPPESNAADVYHQVLATDPTNAVATQGLAEVSAQVLAGFGAELDGGRHGEAQRLIDRAVAVGLGDDAVNDMKGRLEEELARLASVRTLLAEARGFLVDGYVTEPVEANAVARLRDALRLDPGNGEAEDLLAESARRLAAAATDARAAGMNDEAGRYLDLALTVTPGVLEWREMREAWLAESTGA